MGYYYYYFSLYLKMSEITYDQRNRDVTLDRAKKYENNKKY